MFTVLGKHESKHGKAANEALLKKFGVVRAIDIPPKAYERVIAACLAADAPRRRTTRHAARKEDRKLSAFETVINSQDDIKAGLNLAAKAIHSKRSK
ncbi:MAG TPA: hypothetical protein VFC54_01390 [Pseudolabrys sp.]|nr:hypothetical protein [Pseudolabrys sp.]